MKKQLSFLLSSILLLSGCAGMQPSDDGGNNNDPEEDNRVTVNIINSSEDDITISYTGEEKVLPGTTIDFSVSLINENTSLDSLTAFDTKQEEVALTNNGNYSYSFALPEDGMVYVSASVSSTLCYAYFFGPEELLNGNPSIITNDGKKEASLNEGETNYYLLPFGEEVIFSFKETSDKVPLALKVNSELKYIENNEVTIRVPYLDSINLSITYTTKGKNILVNSSEHLTAEIYYKDLTTSINTSAPGETIYFKVVEKPNVEKNRYVVKDVTYSYTKVNDYSLQKVVLKNPDSDGYYSFVMPDSEYDVTINIIEKDMSLLLNYQLPGEYFGFWLASGNSGTYSNLSYDLRVEQDGHIYYTSIGGDNILREDYLISADSMNGDGKAYTTLNHTVYYSDNWLLTNVDGDSTFGEPFGTYDFLAFKKSKEDDIKDDYFIRGETFTANGKKHSVVSIYRKGELYTSCYINKQDKACYFDIEINQYYGETIVSNDAIYAVTKNGTKVVEVSFNSEGGKDHRTILASPYGVYKNDKEEMLVLPNEEFALYKGERYMLEINDNTVVLSNSSVKITLTINTEKMTFELLKEEEISSSIPSFRGLTFSGKGYDEWWECETSMVVAFEEYESDDAIIGTITWGSYPKYIFGFTATFDCDTNMLNITITSENYKVGLVDKTCKALVSDQTITFKSNPGGSTTYTFSGAVVTCSDFHM